MQLIFGMHFSLRCLIKNMPKKSNHALRVRANGEKRACIPSKSETVYPIDVGVLRLKTIELILGLLAKCQEDPCMHLWRKMHL